MSTRCRCEITVENNRNTVKNSKEKKKKDIKIVGSSELEESSSENVSFAAVTKRAWLHIGRVRPGVTCEHIRNHLCLKFPGEDFLIDKIKDVNENSSSVSFRIGADFGLLDDLNKPETWPVGVVVKRFRFFRRYDQKIQI